MSWRVTPNQRGTRRPGRGGMRFLNPGGWTCKPGEIQAPTPPSGPRGVWGLRSRPVPPTPASPGTQGRGARGADCGLAWGPRTWGRWLSLQFPPKLPAPTKKCERRPSPLVLPCTFPTDARWEPAGGPEPRGPGGTACTKAQPAAPAPRLPFQFSPDLRWN